MIFFRHSIEKPKILQSIWLSERTVPVDTYVKDIDDSLDRMSDGDFVTESEITYVGDFAPIHTSLSKIRTTLQGALRDMTSMAQLAEGLNQIATVVQENSSMAESAAATSEELSAESESMLDLVKRFKVDGPAGEAENVAYTDEEISGDTSSDVGIA